MECFITSIFIGKNNLSLPVNKETIDEMKWIQNYGRQFIDLIDNIHIEGQPNCTLSEPTDQSLKILFTVIFEKIEILF